MTRTRKTNRKRNLPGLLCFAGLTFVIGVIFYFFIANVVPFSTAGLEQEYESPSHAIGYESLQRAEPGEVSFDFELTPVNVVDVENTGYMVLVNRYYYLSSEPNSSLLLSAWPTVPVSVVDGMYLHPSALAAVARMLDSARNNGIGSFFVTSGFRSFYHQNTLYNSGMDRAFVLPPGHSEHHTGLAADIQAVGVSMWELANSPQGQWLAANSYRYGLILRYPEGSEHITGVAFEPWHFRYVGVIHAHYIHRNGLVLEEYIERLQLLGHISFEKGGTQYHILHQIPQNGMIYLPDGLEFSVSSDNAGGYIIKAW